MNKLQRQLRKIGFYAGGGLARALPRGWFRRQQADLLRFVATHPDPAVHERLRYYLKITEPFQLSPAATALAAIPGDRLRAYYFDFLKINRYCDPMAKVDYFFGDVYTNLERPTLVKSRLIDDGNVNNVLLKWNAIRHFYFVRHDRPFTSKRDVVGWRGRARGLSGEHRKQVFERWFDAPWTDLGDNDHRLQGHPWQVPFTSIRQQLQNKFLLSIEGQDVATNLKWILSSQSLCLMPRPRCETWFMEGRLQPGVHYVQVRDDFADLQEHFDYYRTHPAAAEAIIANANRWVDQFRDQRLETALQVAVLQGYLELASASR